MIYTNTPEQPITIVGGGPVGSALAIGLAQNGCHVRVLEGADHRDKRWGYDARTLAINLGSYQLLQRLGIIEQLNWYPIKRVRVSQKDAFGTTMLDAHEVDQPSLGYTVIAKDLGKAFDAVIAQHPNIDFQLNASIKGLEQSDQGVQLNTANTSYSAPLVIACDGAFSTVRQCINIPTSRHDFHQIALLAKVEHEQNNHGMAHERFIEQGVFAMLPLSDKKSSMVWVVPEQQAQQKLDLSDEAFMIQANEQFAHYYGGFTQVTDRVHYPMKQTIAQQYLKQHVVLMGNAAHALHPIAGQGLNIGFRDVSAFIALMDNAVVSEQQLMSWALQRQRDAKIASRLTYAMVKGFSHPKASKLGGVTLLGLELAHPLKKAFTRYMMSV